MDDKRKLQTKKAAWQQRHQSDEGGPLAANSSAIPDRSTRGPESAPQQSDPVFATEYQRATETAHPTFPVQADDAAASHTEADIRSRAHAIWESEGRPDGAQDRHWRQAERELGSGSKR